MAGLGCGGQQPCSVHEAEHTLMFMQVPRRKPKKDAQTRAREHLSRTPASGLVHVAFDLSFEATMNAREQTSLVQQIMMCEHMNMQVPAPAQIHLCSFVGNTAKRIAALQLFETWPVAKHEQDVTTVFKVDSKAAVSTDPPTTEQEQETNRKTSTTTDPSITAQYKPELHGKRLVFLTPDAPTPLDTVLPGGMSPCQTELL